MSLFIAASRRASAFRAMTGVLSIIIATVFAAILALPASAGGQNAEPAATPAVVSPAVPESATTQQPSAAMPAAVAALPVPVPPPAAHAAMSIAWPMPSFGPGAPPQIIEPVAIVACRQCRETCFRDYGAQCRDDSCRRALPMCMRNCWNAICR